MKLHRLLLIALLFSAGILKAQTDFRPGYIITLSGDTVQGKIDYRGDKLMGGVCRFKDNDSEGYIKYFPADIDAYRFNESKYFVSKEVNGAKVFLEFLVKGKINVYYLRDTIGDHYFLEKEGMPLTELPYDENIKYIDDKRVHFTSNKHIGILNYYMQDAPEFQKRISEIGIPDHKSLIELSEDYHNKVCKEGACIIYEKKQPYVKLNIEAVAGVINFANIQDLDDKFYFQSGIIAHFWLPRANEKIYFKTGFLFSPIAYTDGTKKGYFLKVPIHIGYLAPKSYRIRPSVSIGLLSPSYSGGVLVNINKRVNIGIQSWVNFFRHQKVPWIPAKFFNYSLLGSVYIDL